MNLKERIGLMIKLGEYLKADMADWQEAKNKAFTKNGWFIPEFIDIAVRNIVECFLDREPLEQWVNHYHLDDKIQPRNIGIVMAGNIPLVGFHDFLSVFISGHRQTIKLSSKDNILLPAILHYLKGLNSEILSYVTFADRLNDCDAYITTGSNNTSRYFEYYFGKYPSIIRKNKTSVAVLEGNESLADIEHLADDICLFFGLGCRNVTKIFVPENYDFEKLLPAFSKYGYFSDHKKFRNNFDYYLTLQVMNAQFYMTNNVIVFVESESLFPPISQVYYSFYKDAANVKGLLSEEKNIQCIVGKDYIPFGGTQQPTLFDYADKIDTMQFLLSL